LILIAVGVGGALLKSFMDLSIIWLLFAALNFYFFIAFNSLQEMLLHEEIKIGLTLRTI